VDSLFDRLEAGIFGAKMENGNAKKGRHKHKHEYAHGHGKAMGLQSQVGSNDVGDHPSPAAQKKKKHRDNSQGRSSQDIDGMSVDLDAPQRYIPTPQKMWKLEKLNYQEQLGSQVVDPDEAATADRSAMMDGGTGSPERPKSKKKRTRRSSDNLDTSSLEGVAAIIDAETSSLRQAENEAKVKNLGRSRKRRKDQREETHKIITIPRLLNRSRLLLLLTRVSMTKRKPGSGKSGSAN